MRRSTRILLLAAAVAIVVSACADTTVVATVDGAAIDEETVAALRNSYADGSSYNAEAYRIDLTNMIYLESQKIAAECRLPVSVWPGAGLIWHEVGSTKGNMILVG